MRDKAAKRFTKSNLPTKTCLTCGRPFAWRKTWERVWADVKYCSKRCSAGRHKGRVTSTRSTA